MKIRMKVSGVEKARKMISPDLMRKVLIKTVNQTGQDCKAELKEEMNRVFDRPTLYTLNSVYTKLIPDEMSVRIGLKEWAGKGTPAATYLKPEVYGGAREMKRSEDLLGHYYVPGAGVKLNKYGNIPGSLITQIISAVGRFREMGYLMNITRRSRKRNKKPRQFFKVEQGNRGLRPGVWERRANGEVRPILIFVDRPTYARRLDFFGVIKRIAAKRLSPNFGEALKRATAINV
jgi:hypothetical protein